MQRTRVILALITLFLGVQLASAQGNKGKDFIISWLPATLGMHNGTHALELHLTSDVPTTVKVEYPVNAPTFVTSVAVAPGAITVVTLPNTVDPCSSPSNCWVPDQVRNNCVRASAPDDFVAYSVNRVPYSSDAALCLPISAMSNEYILADYEPCGPGGGPSEFVVHAAFDDTTVLITPTDNLVGHPLGVTFPVLLQAGEGYQGEGLLSSGSLTGTIITSSKPIGVTNGSECANVPSQCCSDHIYEVAQPVQTWGRAMLVADLPGNPSGTVYRIIAAEDGTVVLMDNLPLVTLGRGEFHETPPLPGNHLFTADNPVFVVQYMTGENPGDPAMGNIIPIERFGNDYTFCAVGGAQFSAHYVTVYADDLDVASGTITLDGSPIPQSEFTSVGTACDSDFSVARLPIGHGSHTSSSSGPHWITVEGVSLNDSYLYPGGVGAAVIPDCDFILPYCDSNLNSSGMAAVLGGTGSPTASANDLHLTASSLPAFQFGYFLASSSQGLLTPPGSQGNLCLGLGNDLGRYIHNVLNSGPSGEFSMQVDLTSVPTATGHVSLMAGDNWNFQAWFRDNNPGPTSNFTNGVAVAFN
ncbi:MAG: hypothetical protein GY711_03980 [bacterium]|nr:hypothetical protein [bacterium]